MKIGDSIYFDHQATTPVDLRVLNKMMPYFTEYIGNPHSTEHSLGWKAAEAVADAKADVAKLLHADSDEIIFTSGATESNNLALHGLVKKASLTKRNKIIISSIEHKCIIELCRMLTKTYPVRVLVVPVDKNGIIDLCQLEKLIDCETLIVSVMAVNNEIGSIQPVAEIGRLANKHGALYHCDASQAPCAIDIDVSEMHIDLLSLSGHKMYAPKGIGGLYVSRSLINKIEPIIYGGGQQENMRSGTVPVPLCVGFGEACKILSELESIYERHALAQKRDNFLSRILSLRDNFHVNGPSCENRHPGNANIRFEGFSAQDLLLAMQPYIAASSGSACTSGVTEPSYVLSAIGLSSDESSSSIRFSLGRYTTEEDTDIAVEIIKNAIAQFDD